MRLISELIFYIYSLGILSGALATLLAMKAYVFIRSYRKR